MESKIKTFDEDKQGLYLISYKYDAEVVTKPEIEGFEFVKGAIWKADTISYSMDAPQVFLRLLVLRSGEEESLHLGITTSKGHIVSFARSRINGITVSNFESLCEAISSIAVVLPDSCKEARFE